MTLNEILIFGRYGTVTFGWAMTYYDYYPRTSEEEKQEVINIIQRWRQEIGLAPFRVTENNLYAAFWIP
jgi:hypothetical protein